MLTIRITTGVAVSWVTLASAHLPFFRTRARQQKGFNKAKAVRAIGTG